MLAFRRLATSCAMLVVLALSLGWSLGVITLLVGQLTIFSMMFVSVVIGLGSDYGIFFLFRYREERVLGLHARRRARAHRGAKRPGHSAGALTAAVTFYILTSPSSAASATSASSPAPRILLAFLSMLTVFPATVLLLDRWRGPRDSCRSPARQTLRGRPDLKPDRAQTIAGPALEWLVRFPRTIVTAADPPDRRIAVGCATGGL
jgi:predicted RND superfamily exporter protein